MFNVSFTFLQRSLRVSSPGQKYWDWASPAGEWFLEKEPSLGEERGGGGGVWGGGGVYRPSDLYREQGPPLLCRRTWLGLSPCLYKRQPSTVSVDVGKGAHEGGRSDSSTHAGIDVCMC